MNLFLGPPKTDSPSPAQATAGFRWVWLAWIILAACALFASVTTRQCILDDTFIHLRYALNFDRTGRVSYNPGQPGSGTSSFLYMLILSAVGRGVAQPHWPMMAKLISVAAYGACLALAISLIPRDAAGRRSPWLILALAFMLAVPSATRWMQDGMETPLAVSFALAAVAAARGWRRRAGRASAGETLCTALLLSLPCLLRVDGAFATAGATILCLLRWRGRSALTLLITVAILCLAWMLIVRHETGSIVPDTAIAKRMGHFFPQFLEQFSRVMLTIAPLWLAGVALLWIDALGVRLKRGEAWIAAFAGSLPILATVAFGTAVGQYIQGARYFLPMLAFAWGVWLLYMGERSRAGDPVGVRSIEMALLALALAASVVHAGFAQARMSRSFARWEFNDAAELHRPGVRVLAYDIGNLGWYTGATVLDMSGLVNGRQCAALPKPARVPYLLKTMGAPEYLMLTRDEAEDRDLNPTGGNTPDRIALRTAGGQTLLYLNTRRLLYSGYNASGNRGEWYLWRRADITSAADAS